MTPLQQQVLDLVNKLNVQEFNSFFNPSEIMATCQVESSFRPYAYRREPSGVASFGLMQVLDVTAAHLGLVGSPEQMYDPEVGLRYGMKCHKADWDYLQAHLHRDPYYEEFAAAYNEGVGNVMKGRTDDAYVRVWMRARDFWVAQGVDD
jgi:soluble lytic murein transglycosylase-like protein